jgi:putative acetyltransferase
MIEIRPSLPSDVADLLRIWREAVDASHGFLAPEDRAAIERLVADYVRTNSLLVATLGAQPVAFMGITGRNIDSLFVAPRAQGLGIGRRMTERVGSRATVDVNEQNDAALGFYRHLGFEVVGRSELDDQGRPYPLLHLKKD